MQLLLHQQHLNNITINLFTDAERWGSCYWSNWWGERGGGDDTSTCSIVIDWRLVTDQRQNNTTTNRRIELMGNRTSLCCEQQRKGPQKCNNQPKERGWCGGTIMLFICYMHNYKTKSNYNTKLYNGVHKYINNISNMFLQMAYCYISVFCHRSIRRSFQLKSWSFNLARVLDM
jgi:hypothetical protein